MSSDPDREVVARIRSLGKSYHVYDHPRDRLKQFLFGSRHRYYREFWALRGVDLEVFKGETLGIVGRNGAGKSTLLQLIAGTMQPTEGEVDVHGRVTALLELGSGFHGDFSGRDNVFLAGAILGMERDEMDARFPEIEEFAGIGHFIREPVSTYSKGMFARLAFAVYASLDPEIFIVDEALAVGDARFRHKCMHRFRKMQEEGISILYVSHDAGSMKQICDRVAWIEGGALQEIGPASQVVDDYLADLFHGDVQSQGSEQGVSSEKLSFDERMGSQLCRFMNSMVTDTRGKRIDHVSLPAEVVLRVEIENRDLDPDSDRIQTGWNLRNARSVVIAGLNTEEEEVPVPLPARGESFSLAYRIQVPMLQPGSYSFTLMVSRIKANGEPELCDRVVNSNLIKVSADRAVSGLVRMQCSIEVLP